MLRSLIALALLVAVSMLGGGCAMCTTPHDHDYPTYGGSWERIDRTHGRVGSVFEPAGAPAEEVAELSAENVAEPMSTDSAEDLPSPYADSDAPPPLPGY